MMEKKFEFIDWRTTSICHFTFVLWRTPGSKLGDVLSFLSIETCKDADMFNIRLGFISLFILALSNHSKKAMIFMNKETLKYILTIFSICATLQETDDMSIAHSWILTEIVRFLICTAVFLILTFLLDAVFPNKKESH
ncbi:hypothetical protein MOC02_04255 [Bacillus inaquosorum]|uniref:hypothetical protein n=1 Tax=Bacillus inaquosorum TaxID=483913 RepID=UPI0022806B58|nr:hypothetical protein [Bacillus inaquosorum]MCY8082505.1 hypothetical protein [Bacillus inaquosorum]MCY8169461.1 hypothetical protein [Bacillus inaquosorum]